MARHWWTPSTCADPPVAIRPEHNAAHRLASVLLQEHWHVLEVVYLVIVAYCKVDRLPPQMCKIVYD